jgi:hypothetical protein
MLRCQGGRLQPGVAARLGLGRRHVADRLEQARVASPTAATLRQGPPPIRRAKPSITKAAPANPCQLATEVRPASHRPQRG